MKRTFIPTVIGLSVALLSLNGALAYGGNGHHGGGGGISGGF